MFEQSVQFELVQGDAGVNNGALLETMAAQELVANGYDQCYFDKSKYGELDFVIPQDSRVLPIEIKPGKNYRKHRTLDKVMAVDEWGIQSGCVFCPGNVQIEGYVCYMPWYMLMFCKPLEYASLPVAW